MNFEGSKYTEGVKNKNVVWLKKHVPAEDIYSLAEQLICSSLYFMSRWAEWVEIPEEMKRDENAKNWVKAICGMRILQQCDSDISKFIQDDLL